MRNLLFLLAIITFTISCSSEPETLSFTEFEVEGQDGDIAIVTNPDGNIEIDGIDAGTLNHDGMLVDTNGNLIAEITDNNMLVDAEGNELVEISPNGEIDISEGVFTGWSERGQLMQGDRRVGFRIKPADQNSYQAASMVSYIYFTDKQKLVPEASAE